jgi:hypothetical protein
MLSSLHAGGRHPRCNDSGESGRIGDSDRISAVNGYLYDKLAVDSYADPNGVVNTAGLQPVGSVAVADGAIGDEEAN